MSESINSQTEKMVLFYECNGKGNPMTDGHLISNIRKFLDDHDHSHVKFNIEHCYIKSKKAGLIIILSEKIPEEYLLMSSLKEKICALPDSYFCY